MERNKLLLSKSRIQSGRQCHKRLWLEMNAPDDAVWDDSAQARLDEGTRFGELARDLLGGGQLIEQDHLHVDEALAETEAALMQSYGRVPTLFEPCFSHQGVRVRVDALKRGRNSDTLIEVKSTSQVKEEHLWDCAIQTWVARGAGRPVRRILLAHANRRFVYRRPGIYRGLLAVQDITRDVNALQPEIPKIVRKLKAVAAGAEPKIATGSHCDTPYPCPFHARCASREPAPPEYPITILPHGGRVVQALLEEGFRDLREVPEDRLDRPRHQRIARATREGKPLVSDELAATLGQLPYPRYYLDFETINFVVPRWLGTRPFQKLPFQFSCHVQADARSLSHSDFLDTSGDSSLEGFVEALLASVGRRGPILVWNKGFEGSCLRELAHMFPQHTTKLSAIERRLVDLLPIYREHYYHPQMRGSWSIKSVLPTIAPELNYGDLAVGDGDAAQSAYLEATGAEVTPQRRDGLRRQLLAYCERDTLALVRLAQG